jgi:hypothetical protein
MTRRKFIKKIIKAGSVIIAGSLPLVRKASPRKFVRAFKAKGTPFCKRKAKWDATPFCKRKAKWEPNKYPGSIVPIGDISKQGKWSG